MLGDRLVIRLWRRHRSTRGSRGRAHRRRGLIRGVRLAGRRHGMMTSGRSDERMNEVPDVHFSPFMAFLIVYRLHESAATNVALI